MNRLIYVLLLGIWSFSLASQSDNCTPIAGLSTGFESCTTDPNGIANGCAPGWFPSTGSPSLSNNVSGATPYEGNRMVVMSTSSSSSCQTEAMFLSVPNLTAGDDYELSFWVRTQTPTTSGTLDFYVDYTSGVPVNSHTSVTGPCPAIPGSPLYTNTGFASTSWVNVVIPFTAQAGNNQLHFIPRPNGSGNPVRLLLDLVEVSYCDPCVDVSVTASFRLSADPFTSSLYKLKPDLYNTYDNIDAEHTWRIFRSDSPNGPYTYLATYTADDFTYPASYGYYYTVFHKVVTECGTDCYGWNICQGCGGFGSNSCEYCGPIDCSIVDNLCTIAAPRSLTCRENKYKQEYLDWATVIGATSYQVEFSPGGECCDEYQNFTPFTLSVTSSQINPPANIGDCFSWRVKAFCEDGTQSDWSDSKCTDLDKCGFVIADEPGPGPDPDVGIQSSSDQELLRIYPNPTSGQVTVDLGKWSTLPIRLELRSGTGNVIAIDSRVGSNDAQRVLQLDHLPAGIYWLRIYPEGEAPVSKRIIVQ